VGFVKGFVAAVMIVGGVLACAYLLGGKML